MKQVKSFRSLISMLSTATVAGSMAFAGAPQEAKAQEYPSRAIAWVVPFTPGGITDTASRLVAKVLTENMGQSVVIENRSGAGGMIGTEYVARSAPDGYTWIYATQGTMASNPSLYKTLRYDPKKDFVPVRAMMATPTVLVVNADRPYKTVQELVDYAKKNPGKVNFGSAGPGTGTHLSAELFQAVAGIKMTHIPYKGSAPALNDLVGGAVDVMFDYPVSAGPHIRAGKLRALVMTGRSRLNSIPDVPTVAEAGFPGAEMTSWSGIMVPAGTPEPVVKRISDELGKALAHPEVQTYAETNGSTILKDVALEKFAAYLDAEMKLLADVVKRAGIEPK